MKRYVKSTSFESLEEQHYDSLFNQHNKETDYSEEKDVLEEEFIFDNTVIPIKDGDITDKGWDILADCSNYDDLSESDVPVMINNYTKTIDTLDTGTILEGIRDSLLDTIPNLPLEGKCNIKVTGTFVLKFPFTYKETYNPDNEEYSYDDVDIDYTPECEIKNFSYEIL